MFLNSLTATAVFLFKQDNIGALSEPGQCPMMAQIIIIQEYCIEDP